MERNDIKMQTWGLRRILKVAAVTGICLIILGYSLFEARNLIAGPMVVIDEPLSGTAFTASLIDLKGSAKNIVDISLNDRKIFVDGEGRFREQLLLFYGYNILTITAHDRFGRETIKTLKLIYH